MKKLVKFFTLFLTLALVVCLASCGKKQTFNAAEMAEAIQFDFDKKTVSFKIDLSKNAERMLDDGSEKVSTPVTWSTNDSRIQIKDYVAYLTYDEAQKDTPAKITGSVEVNGEKASSEYQFRINKVSTYEEFINAQKGESITVEGYISYLGEYSTKYGNFTMTAVSKDKAHSYYAFRASCKAEVYQQLQEGMLVGLTGDKSNYNGPQLEKANITIIGGDTFVEEATELTPAVCKDDETLTPELNKFVRASEAVVTSEFNAKNNSFDIQLKAVDGKTADAQVNLNKYFYDSDESADKQALIAKLATVKAGDTINVEGLLAMYKGTANINLVNADKLTVVKSDAELNTLYNEQAKVKSALGKLNLGKAGNVNLPTVAEGMTVAYALEDTTQTVLALSADGKQLVVNPIDVETKVNVLVTLTKGEKTITFSKQVSSLLSFDEEHGFLDLVTKTTNLTATEANHAKTIGLDEKVWTVTTTKAETLNPDGTVKYGNEAVLRTDGIRIYKGTNNGTMTFKHASKQVTELFIKYKTDSKNADAIVVINGVEYTMAGQEGLLKVTLTTPSDTVKLEAKGKQVRINKIGFNF